eukprot:5111329-Amphidinium_carterae.2
MSTVPISGRINKHSEHGAGLSPLGLVELHCAEGHDSLVACVDHSTIRVVHTDSEGIGGKLHSPPSSVGSNST